MFYSLRILVTAVFTAVTVACGRTITDTRPVLVVSLEPQCYLLEQIAGDEFRIITLLPNGENPEIFEPSMAKRMEVDNCEVYFTIGYLPFEENIASSSNGKVKIVKTTDGIKPEFGTHCSHHHGYSHHIHDVDPHMWTSVRNARQMCSVMKESLQAINPDSADIYELRFRRFDSHLDSLDNAFSQRLGTVKDRPFMVWHPSLTYFARDYDLRQISVSQYNKENSMIELRNVIDSACAAGAKVFFSQRDYDARQAITIATNIGARLVAVNPCSYSWEYELNNIVDELCKP